MRIEELKRLDEISVRSYHVCKYNGLNTVDDLVRFYRERGSFESLRNCGKKSNSELIKLCIKYWDHLDPNSLQKINEENKQENIAAELTSIQRDIINRFILLSVENLSVRSKNAITNHLRGKLNIRSFNEKIFVPHLKTEKIKNAGKKSVKELDDFFKVIKDFILEISKTKDEKLLIPLNNKFLIQRTFSIKDVPEDILEASSIFKLIDFLIKSNAFFDSNQTFIIIHALRIYQNTPNLSLNEIGQIIEITRERVRQLRNTLSNEIGDKLNLIRFFNDDLFQNYDLDVSNSLFLDIDDDKAALINTKSGTLFSRDFIIYVLSIYLNNSFSVLGNFEDILFNKSITARSRHNWKHFYLLSKELYEEFDFYALSNDINKRLDERIEEDYTLNIKSYSFNFLLNGNIEILDRLIPVIEFVINSEHQIYLDLEDNILFKRNTKKQVHEYSYEALVALGEPSTVNEIYKKVKESNPNYNITQRSIRSSLKRKHGFVPIGRTSVFGLKKWEEKINDFKGGTIREIVSEYLSNKKEPIHISDITEYVKTFRPNTNEHSVLGNLKLDKSATFAFFENAKIGLRSIEYSNSFVLLSELQKKLNKRSWEDSKNALKKFTERNNRLPSSSGDTENERKLYRWLNLQKLKYSKGKLNEDKWIKIRPYLERYTASNTPYRKPRKSVKFEELLEFVQNNNRLPKANNKSERNLYFFYYNKSRKLKDDSLDLASKDLLIEIANILKQQKNEF